MQSKVEKGFEISSGTSQGLEQRGEGVIWKERGLNEPLTFAYLEFV